MFRRKRDKTLYKIIAAIVILGVAGFGVSRLLDRMGGLPGTAADAVMLDAHLAKARELLDGGKTEEASKLLETIAAEVAGPAATADILTSLAGLEQKRGNREKALEYLERAYREFPQNPNRPAVAVAYAQALEENGRKDDAAGIYQEVRNDAPPEMRAPAQLELGRQAEKEGDLVKARDLYRKAVEDAPWDGAAWREAVDALGKTNVALIFSPTPTPESKRYSVGKGDSITSIGNSLNVTQGTIMRANSVDESTVLQQGQQLKYTPKDFHIVIERSKCRLFLVDKDGIFKCYSVGLGKPGHETTLGSYKIGNKVKDPTWHKPGAGPIPAGDPANELGTRWMPLVPDQEGLPKDLGIHGTIRPETVGQYSSMGCARLLPGEVEELYDLVVRSTPVDIVETFVWPNEPPAPGAPPA